MSTTPSETRSASRRRRRTLAARAAVMVTVSLTAACGGAANQVDTSGVDRLTIPTPSPDPADFVADVDNRWLPLAPGTRWRHRAVTGSPRRVMVTVLPEPVRVAGVATTATLSVTIGRHGRVVARETRYYAQDEAGNVWLFGVEGGAASWRAGAAGAEAGLAMPAEPRIGDGWLEESAPGVAENVVRVLSVDAERTVAGHEHDDLVETELTSELEPGLLVRTYYASGRGPVAVEVLGGDRVGLELLSGPRPAS